MKKISVVNKIWLILALIIIGLIVAYAYLSFYVVDGSSKTFFSEIVLSLINGFVLALMVFVASILIEEKRRKEIKAQEGDLEILKLTNILKNVFNRGKSLWNFTNRTPTFYFDDSWINPLYDLLTQNKREWDTFLREYRIDDDKNVLSQELIEFVDIMELALINAENLDNSLRKIKLNPSLAASMESGYSADRNEAKQNSEFGYWVFRATWAGLNSTKILFGMTVATDRQLKIERIDGLMIEAISLGETDDFSELVLKLKKDRKRMEIKLKKIKKVIDN